MPDAPIAIVERPVFGELAGGDITVLSNPASLDFSPDSLQAGSCYPRRRIHAERLAELEHIERESLL